MDTPAVDASPPRVVVVGAGIAGLAAAATLRRGGAGGPGGGPGGTDRGGGGGPPPPGGGGAGGGGGRGVGGKLRLAEVGGVTVDVGAEAMLARRPEAVDLASAAGLDDMVVNPATTAAGIWSRDAVRAMPRTLMGVPVDAKELGDSGLLSK